MRIVVAPDSFKGTLTAREAAGYMAQGIQRISPEAEILCFPIADGGEGTAQALMEATGGRWVAAEVCDPLMRPVNAGYGVLGDGETAVVELAAASGLTLLKLDERNPLVTTTYGTGQLIRAALEAGYRRLIIGIGGSATHDGGLGMLQALGACFYDSAGALLPTAGGLPATVSGVDTHRLDRLLEGVETVAACDVDNPLCGPTGAAAVFAPPKGAPPEAIPILDQRLRQFGAVTEAATGRAVMNMAGAGAAGGVGGALHAYLGAALRPGIDIVLERAGLLDRIASSDLVITGEGSLDGQTLHGKAPVGIARAARRYGVPVIGIAGVLGPGSEGLFSVGFVSLHALAGSTVSVEEAMTRAGELLAARTAEALNTYLKPMRA